MKKLINIIYVIWQFRKYKGLESSPKKSAKKSTESFYNKESLQNIGYCDLLKNYW